MLGWRIGFCDKMHLVQGQRILEVMRLFDAISNRALCVGGEQWLFFNFRVELPTGLTHVLISPFESIVPAGEHCSHIWRAHLLIDDGKTEN